MKHYKFPLILIVLAIFLFNCSTEDVTGNADQIPDSIEETEEENPEEPEPTLEESRETSVTLLTANDEKVWRIASAELENANGAFNISDNFNIKDDEFIFRNSDDSGKGAIEFDGLLEWRQNSAIELNAQSQNGALTERYVLPRIFRIAFSPESSSELKDEDSKFVFTINASGEITAVLDLGEGIRLTLTLTVKLATDYPSVPTESLDFDTVFTFESNAIAGNSPDMVGSLVNNSIYIAMREDDLGDPGQPKPERILRYDRTTGAMDEKLFTEADFVSKQLVINGDKLLVVGAKVVNVYNLDIVANPVSYHYAQFDDSIALSRFGTAVVDNTVYLVGGNILYPDLANRIHTFYPETGAVETIAELPEARYGARAEIVNDKLYIFGGTEAFSAPPAKNTIYIYDLSTGEITTKNMPTAVDVTFTGRYGNLIYVAGSVINRDNEGNIIDETPYMGVYDTDQGAFSILETNLLGTEKETIHAMAIMGDQMFIIYGQKETVAEGYLQEWTVRAADL